ncbi:MAG: dihydrodipicolinate synthase family protein [Spirochaetaceae bacterium]|nr:MAG: dihydrodipicolinate synthase family protein [Spirochaetaceae bacterium]
MSNSMARSTTTTRIQGVIAAAISPMHEDGSLDKALFERHVRYLVEAGVHGLFIGGTAGEGPYLSSEERIELFRIARGIVGASLPLYLAFLRPDTRTVIREMAQAERLLGDSGPDYVSAVAPLYYPVGQEALRGHFSMIADAAPVPLILYNIPGNTHNALDLQTIQDLAQHEQIAGIKESSGDFALFSQGLLEADADSFSWIQGKDHHDGPALMLGAPALITGLGNVWIEPYVALYRAVCERNWQRVNDAQLSINRLSRAVRSGGGAPLPSIKAAAMARWKARAFTRLPSMELPADVAAQTQRLVQQEID